MNANDLAKLLGDACYIFLTINFLWGLYCVILGWRLVRQLSFRRPQEQHEFLDEVLAQLQAGRYDSAAELGADDERALPQLAQLAIANRNIGYEPLVQLVTEVMQRDVLGEIEYRTIWIATVIKSGPLLGLFGTVLGMMAAFGRIGEGTKVDAAHIADEISIALICTAMGLATAIPFNFLLAAINVRLRRLQDSLSFGMARILDFFRTHEV
jgi:biopolymer transport protein ExbB/TolQ